MTFLALVFFALALLAQDAPGIGDVGGPGQAIAQPPAQCPRALACTYVERRLVPAGYRFQSLQACGANCTTQYWLSALADGQPLLEIDPLRGGGVVAVSRAVSSGGQPPVRTVVPTYAPDDPACCPSAYRDTTYTWDAASGALVAAEPSVTAASEFPGWDAVRQALDGQGFEALS